MNACHVVVPGLDSFKYLFYVNLKKSNSYLDIRVQTI